MITKVFVFLLWLIFLFIKNCCTQNCIQNEGLLMISTGQIVGRDVSLYAVFEFPAFNPPPLIDENLLVKRLYTNITSRGATISTVRLFEIDTDGYKDSICASEFCILLPINESNFQTGIFIEVEYYISLNNTDRIIKAPIINLKYDNFLPDYNLSNGECFHNTTIHQNSTEYGFVAVQATDCYCCPSASVINCPNLSEIPFGNIFPNKTIGIPTTTGRDFGTTHTVNTNVTPSPTSFPQPNCTNPTDSIIIAYCNANKTQEPPGDIANNITDSLVPQNLTGYDIYLLAQIMQTLTATKNLTEFDFHSISRMTDVILEGPTGSFEDSNDGSTESTLTMLKSIYHLMYNSPNNVSFLNGSNLGLSNFRIDCSQNNSDTSLSENADKFSTTAQSDASISISSNTICIDRTSRRLFYGIYRNTKLFVANPIQLINAIPKNTLTCNNGFWYNNNKVLTGTLLDDNSTVPYPGSTYIVVNGTRQKIVTIKYSKSKTLRPLHGTLKVSWWTGFVWSNETCSIRDDGDYWVSECDHLTDFTLLVDGIQDDPSLCNNGLIIISYIIYIGSIISLFILNLIFISQKFLYTDGAKASFLYGTNQTINVFTFVYNMELMIFYILFGIFSDQRHTTGEKGCQAVAIINYWLLLSCITMTIFQAWKILKAFSWSTTSESFMTWLTNKFLILTSTICVPTIISLSSGLTIKHFYDREDNFCWIRPDYILFGMVLPLSLMIANGLFCFCIVLLRLFPKIFGISLVRSASSSLGNKRPKKKEKLVALVIMQFILGIPWILQYFTIFTPHITAWHYLFTVVNGSQGIILLLIYSYKSYNHYKHQKYKVTRERAISSNFHATPPSGNVQRIRSITNETNVANGITPKTSRRMKVVVNKPAYENEDFVRNQRIAFEIHGH